MLTRQKLRDLDLALRHLHALAGEDDVEKGDGLGPSPGKDGLGDGDNHGDGEGTGKGEGLGNGGGGGGCAWWRSPRPFKEVDVIDLLSQVLDA